MRWKKEEEDEKLVREGKRETNAGKDIRERSKEGKEGRGKRKNR